MWINEVSEENIEETIFVSNAKCSVIAAWWEEEDDGVADESGDEVGVVLTAGVVEVMSEPKEDVVAGVDGVEVELAKSRVEKSRVLAEEREYKEDDESRV